MQTAMSIMAFSITGVMVSLIVFMVSLGCFIGDIRTRVYPDGNKQPLITVCQVDEKIKRATKETKKGAGYFYHKKQKRNCWTIGESADEITVGWKTAGKVESNIFNYIAPGVYHNYKNIPKKDFHAYHNLTQVSKEELKKILK